MTVIVTDAGFSHDDWTGPYIGPADCAANDCNYAVDVASNIDPLTLENLIHAPMIRIAFPSFADGRGFTLAVILRRAGYTGRLRACGHIIADQYAMARRAGFDEVEIDNDLATRQPEAQWLARADWRDHNYQAYLRGEAFYTSPNSPT